jgi:formate dehydrogenase iron-sulfur subunit
MCSTKALLAGDAAEISNIFRDRVLRRGKGVEAWGWMTAYGAEKEGAK